MVEDDPKDAELVEHVLRQSGIRFSFERVETRQDFIHALEKGPDVILSDHGLPQFDGWAALNLSRSLRPRIPFIFVAGRFGDEGIIAAFEKGAADFVLKDQAPASLPGAIQRAVEKSRTIYNEPPAIPESDVLLRMSEPFLSVDRNGAVLMANQSARELFQLDPAKPAILWDLAPGLLGGRFHETFFRAISENRMQSGEDLSPDTGRLWEYRIYPGADGASIFYHDLTEQKGMRRSDAVRRIIGDIALDAIISIDHKGMVHDWNPAAERIFGYRREDAIGRELAELIIPSYLRHFHRQGLAQYLETGESEILGRRVELLAVRSDGTEFPVELSVNRLPLPGLPSYIGFVRDITDRKESDRQQELRFKQQLAVAQLGQRALTATDFHHLLQESCEMTARVLHMDAVQIWRLDSDRKTFVLRAAVGLESKGEVDAAWIPPAGWMEKWQQAIEPESAPVSQADFLQSMPGIQPERLTGVITNPIHAGKDPFGMMVCLHRNGVSLSIYDLQFLKTMANILADSFVRIQSQEQLAESEERFRLLVEGIQNYAICMLDPSGCVSTWNSGGERIVGYSTHEVMNHYFGNFLHPVDPRSGDPEIFLEEARREGRFDRELQLRRKDGSIFWGHVVLTPLHNERRQLYGFSQIIRDITDRKRWAESLKASEERFRMLVENVQDYAIFMLDPEGRITSWNSGAERLTGYSFDQAIGRDFGIFYPPEDIRSGKPRRILNSAHEEGAFQEEGWRMRQDGSRIWTSTLITPLHDETGKLYGFSTIARDMTERKAAQEVIFRLNADLEQRVARRTSQLEAANKELEAFSYSVSHDLRAPLRHIAGFANLLETTVAPQLDERGKNYLKIIGDSAREMGKLIDDLLEFSRMGRADLRKTPIQTTQLVSQIIRDFQSEIKDRKIEWVLQPLPNIHGDPALLRQVFVNLLSNAIKYTRKKENARVEIGSRHTENEIIIFVKDNGVGFDMQYAPKLFGVFQRLHSPREFEGTGIGLANVRRIVQRHGGRAWAEGAPNQGATIYFSIPIQPEDL